MRKHKAPARPSVITKSQSTIPLPHQNSYRPRARSKSRITSPLSLYSKKLSAQDPDNYAAWFDLGFLYNAQGKTDESIAAYRKSVAAKPSVFESNLNLGLMLVKAHQPDAEQFLRAATKLKPTAHAAKGQARAWLSLGHLLETTNPEGAIEAFKQAALLDPKDPSRTFHPA